MREKLYNYVEMFSFNILCTVHLVILSVMYDKISDCGIGLLSVPVGLNSIASQTLNKCFHCYVFSLFLRSGWICCTIWHVLTLCCCKYTQVTKVQPARQLSEMCGAASLSQILQLSETPQDRLFQRMFARLVLWSRSNLSVQSLLLFKDVLNRDLVMRATGCLFSSTSYEDRFST